MTTNCFHTNNGSFEGSAHIAFVKNRKRNDAFRKALERISAGKTVLEIGTGSGILSIYAALAGAKHVFTFEKDPTMIKIARNNINTNHLSEKITLIEEDISCLNSSDLEKFGDIDIVLGELLSTWSVVEPQVNLFSYLLANVSNAPIPIPYKILNYVQGVEASFGDLDNLVSIPSAFFEFTYLKQSERLTNRNIANIIKYDSLVADFNIQLIANKRGKLNALRLTSRAYTASNIYFGSSNDTFIPTIFPLNETLEIKKGDIIQIRIKYEYGCGWDSFKISDITKNNK